MRSTQKLVEIHIKGLKMVFKITVYGKIQVNCTSPKPVLSVLRLCKQRLKYTLQSRLVVFACVTLLLVALAIFQEKPFQISCIQLKHFMQSARKKE